LFLGEEEEVRRRRAKEAKENLTFERV